MGVDRRRPGGHRHRRRPGAGRPRRVPPPARSQGRALSSTGSAPDVVVIGGGVAGLSALYHLAPERRTLLLEREPTLAAHASGRNAAMFRPLELDETTAELASQGLALVETLAGAALCDRRGLLLVAPDAAPIDTLAAHARRHTVRHERLDAAGASARAASLAGGHTAHALSVPDAGVLDIHAMTSALARAARDRGGAIETGAGVRRVIVEGGRVVGVEREDGTRLATGGVVLAAGAWSAELGAAAGAPLALRPMRRHLVHLGEPGPCRAGDPIVWQVGEDEMYYRPEAGGVLATPGDAEPWPPEHPPADAGAVDTLARKLARLAPGMITSVVRSRWACLRTFAPDHELVVGPDPRVTGLAWLGGFGGRGMAVAPAAGAVLADLVSGRPHRLAARLSPLRAAA